MIYIIILGLIAGYLLLTINAIKHYETFEDDYGK